MNRGLETGPQGGDVTAIRIMTYHVRQCRGRDGLVSADRVVEVIAEGAADIVALQDVGSPEGHSQLDYLSKRLGMEKYGELCRGGNAFLSYYPLKGLQEYDLGRGGVCLRADVDLGGKRLHLFNLCLQTGPQTRQRQISALVGPDILGSSSLTCPTLVLGDFADCLVGAGNIGLNITLRKARRPLWPGTYPAFFPVAGRDRAYLRGHLRVLHSSILRSYLARKASTHLPAIFTVQITDPRNYLHAQPIKSNRCMEIAPG